MESQKPEFHDVIKTKRDERCFHRLKAMTVFRSADQVTKLDEEKRVYKIHCSSWWYLRAMVLTQV